MHDPHQEQDDSSLQHHRYPSPPPPMNDNTYISQDLDATDGLTLEDLPELPSKDESDAPSPGRSKPIPKPDREVTKGDDGRFICTWVGCAEDVRTFNRKCEWSKHMDKHDRPYKCPSEGCEKLPGFTYSGGLLRHQREVHNLHGGPRKQLNCPHPNCKRFSGKGFSRQENLNEHLRRVHTDAAEVLNAEETEDEGSEVAGMKRKRPQYDGVDVRMEMKRLRKENEDLKRQAELQTSQTNELMRQLQNLQNLVGSRIQQVATIATHHQAPQATMM
ncbi:putative zinc finger protein GLI2 [Rhexocercosporidium sp. MPI-PUGE-AT-0058]|nr:putative zinc finger protein GLI2 [Rhexocercosporidium sp. MPI-PUGE-AT-0058]